MLTNRLYRRTARLLSRGGFTLVELLVVIGIIAILAGVALGPITRGIAQAKESGSMQVTRQIGLAEFAYSNDNNQIYPYDTTSEKIAIQLLAGNYVSDPGIFYVSGTPNSSKPTGLAAPFTGLTAQNCNFDFMVNSSAGGSGLNSNAGDGTPMVQLTGGTLTMVSPTPTTGIPCTINAALTAFGTDGLAVSYKSNSAAFKKATVTGPNAATINGFVDASYNDPQAASYHLVTP